MRARRLAVLTCALLLMLLAPTVALPRASAQTSVEFTSITAEANFPDSIEFAMEATAPQDIERVQVFWRAAQSSVVTMADADYTYTDTLRAFHVVDTTIQYLPPGLDLVYYWTITTSDGEVHTSPEQTLFYMDTRFEWSSVEAGLIEVWWYRGPESFAAEVAHSANRTVVSLQADYGLQATEPIRILVYATDEDFSGALRANSADWIGGVAHSSLNLILGYIGTEREIGRMIPHEIAHVVVEQASANPYNSPPPWLDEGLATYIQDVADPRLAPVLDRAVREGRLIPLGALRSSFPADPDQALLSYAESQSVVRYLVEIYGTQDVGELVSVYRQGIGHDRAVEEVLGISIDELDASWKSWLGYQGDQVDDPYIAASEAEQPGTAWFLVVFAAAAIFAGGLIAFVFWRTRSYKDTDEPEDATSSP